MGSTNHYNVIILETGDAMLKYFRWQVAKIYMESKPMILANVKAFVQYITEGFLQIFRPNDEPYPAIGVQPFRGTIYNNSKFDW